MPVAVAMGAKTFQGTLWKICDGRVASPSRGSAERIAKHFGIPLDAIYSEKIAAEVWAREFATEATTPEAEPAQPQPGPAHAGREAAEAVAAAPWPFRRISAEQWAALDGYDQALVEDAAFSRLRELQAQTRSSSAAVVQAMQPRTPRADDQRGGGLRLTPAQADRRRDAQAVEIDRRHDNRRATDKKT